MTRRSWLVLAVLPFLWVSDLHQLNRRDPYHPKAAAIHGGTLCFVTFVITAGLMGSYSNAFFWVAAVIATTIAAALCWAVAKTGDAPRSLLAAEVWGQIVGLAVTAFIAFGMGSGWPFWSDPGFWGTWAVLYPIAVVMGARFLAPIFSRRPQSRS